MDKSQITKKWKELDFSGKLNPHLGGRASLIKRGIVGLKETKKSSLWLTPVNIEGKTIPIILKILPSLQLFQNQVEIEMYRNVPSSIQSFLPTIYHIEPNVNDGETWILIQCVYPVRTEWKMTPQVFDKIIPAVSNFHSKTHELVFSSHTLADWLPIYHSREGYEEREKFIKRTERYLDRAIANPALVEIIKPYYDVLKKSLQKGPINFPELEEAGFCITHGDLHMKNICLRNLQEKKDNELLFIDWESAEYTSGWFDIAHLVGILLEYRPDWQKQDEEIIKHCANLYASEMKQRGIVFHADPLTLYKMAYVQRILERWLHYQLRIALKENAEPSTNILLPRFMEKVNRWGKELDLI